jgi:hypothetical protein
LLDLVQGIWVLQLLKLLGQLLLLFCDHSASPLGVLFHLLVLLEFLLLLSVLAGHGLQEPFLVHVALEFILVVGATLRGGVPCCLLRKCLDLALFELLGDATLDLLSLLNSASLEVLVFALEAFLVFCKGTVHNSEKVIFDLLDIFLDFHEPLKEDVELLIEPDHFKVSIGLTKIKKGLCLFVEFFIAAVVLEEIRVTFLWGCEEGGAFDSLFEVFTIFAKRVKWVTWRTWRPKKAALITRLVLRRVEIRHVWRQQMGVFLLD